MNLRLLVSSLAWTLSAWCRQAAHWVGAQSESCLMRRSFVLQLSTVALSVANYKYCSDVEDCLGKASIKLSSSDAVEKSLAIQLYEAAIQYDFECKDAWLGLGGCQKELGLLQSSIISFSVAFSLDPLCWRVSLNIASVLAMQSEFETAKRMYKHIIRTHPYHPQAFYSMGYIHLYQVYLRSVFH